MAIMKKNKRKSITALSDVEVEKETIGIKDLEEVAVISQPENSAKKETSKKRKNKSRESNDDNDQEATFSGKKSKKRKAEAISVDSESEKSKSKINSGDEIVVVTKSTVKTKQSSKKNKPRNLSSIFEDTENDNENDADNETSENDRSKGNKYSENQNLNSSKKGKIKNLQNKKTNRNSLIIGNLPYSATNNVIQELLQTVLPKSEIKICNVASSKDGKTKGFAYVEVTSKEAVQKVLQLNGTKLENRKILIAVNDKKITNIYANVKNTLYIDHISKSATDGQIIEFIEKVIPTSEILQFLRARTSRGEPMSYIILEVASEEAVEQLKELNGVVLEGQEISIDSYRTSVINPNFTSTKHPTLLKKRSFKKNEKDFSFTEPKKRPSSEALQGKVEKKKLKKMKTK